MRSRRAISSSRVRFLTIVFVLFSGVAAMAFSGGFTTLGTLSGLVSATVPGNADDTDIGTENHRLPEASKGRKTAGGAEDRFIYGKGDLPLDFPKRIDKIHAIGPGGPLPDLGSVNDFEPAWSPDGEKIVFVSLRDGPSNNEQYRNIYKMNPDGTDQELISSGPYVGGEAQPSFSFHTNPSQQRIVYVADYSGQDNGIYTVDANGYEAPVRLNTDGCFPQNEKKGRKGRPKSGNFGDIGLYGFDTPNYSPDNNYIIFGYENYYEESTDIYRINADGTNCIRLYQGDYGSNVPTTARYSRDGSRIALYHLDTNSFPYKHMLRIIHAATGQIMGEFEPTNFQGSPVWSPYAGENKIAYIGGENDPDNPIANLEIRTIDLGGEWEEQVIWQGVPEGIRGMDWGIPTSNVPSLTLRINQPHPILGGTSTTGTLTLSSPAPEGGAQITLQAYNPIGQTIISLPVTQIEIPAGQTQANFQIDAPPRIDHRVVDISATRPSPNYAFASATVSVTPSKPDLRAVSVTAPPSVAPGVSFNLSTTIENIGQATTGSNFGDRFYFSTDDVLDPSDPQFREFTNGPGLPAGETRTVATIPATIPASIAPAAGQYYIFLRTNWNESIDEGGRFSNNTAMTTIQIDLPDVVAEDLTVPTLIEPGVNYQVSWTTRNAGTVTTGAFSSRLYYSPDETFGDANDILIDTVANSALAANATQQHTRSFNISTVPARPDGTAYFYVKVDHNNTVYEGLPTGPGENNNTTIASTPFEYRVADLQVTTASAPPEVETETPFAVQWTTANTGNKNAGNFVDRVYFSLDDQVGSDLLVGDFPLSGGLTAGTSADRIQNITIPTSAISASGNYWVYVRTDATTNINEGENENNNIRFQPIYVRRLLRPDLVVSNITAPAAAFFDQTVQVQWTVTNNGEGPTNAPQWTDSLYIGSNSNTTSGSSKLADVNSVSALNPGESYTASAVVKIPRGMNGALHFLVRTNSNSAVNEESTANNLFSDPVQINVPPLPDLLVDNVQSPDEVFAGQPISINYTIRNIGTDGAGYRRDRIYFSRDTTLDSADRLVFTSDSLASPEPGQTTTHTSQNRVGNQNPPVFQPARVPSDIEGLWYVFVVADYGNDVYEFTNENNNSDYDKVEPGSPINVLITPPDLVVPNEPTAPTTAASGMSVPVSFTVKNQGAFNASANLRHAVYLSTDQTFDKENDTLIGSIKDPDPFAPAGEHPLTLNVDLPNCLANGTYYLFAMADYDERQFEFDPGTDAEANNASPAREIQLSTVPPDLQVTGLQASAVSAPGQDVQVTWTVSNLGGPTTRSWTDRIYLRSTAPGVSQKTLGSFDRAGGLGAGANYTESRSLRLPSFMEGEYYFAVTTDANEKVPECGTAEDNNSAQTGTFNVDNNLPDLVIDSVTAPSSSVVGNSFMVQWAGRNANQPMPGNSPNWRDNVYLSTDPSLSNGDIYLGGAVNETRLAAGQTYEQQANVQIGNVSAGTYYILVVADGGSHIEEGTSNSAYETNNVRASLQITLSAPPIDLQAGNVSVSLPHHSGSFRQVSWTVTNTGTSPTLASQWSDYVVLSRDGVLDSSDTTLGYVRRSAVLAGGESYTGSGTFFIPVGLTGAYRVFAITDKGNSVVESNESNNLSSPAMIDLTLPPPAELSITNISQPTTINLGGNASFNWTVQNTGSNAVNGKWRDTVYLSRDQFWDASDVLVGVRDLDSQTTSVPAEGGTYSTGLTIPLPPVEEGSYYVIVRTDAQNRVRETDEGNNVTTSVGTTSVTITELQLNTPFNTTLANGGQQFFKYATDPGETLLFSLTTGIPNRSNELFTKFGTVASRADHDVQGSRPGEGNQENLIAETQEGNYFSMVRTDHIPESFAGNFEKSPKANVPSKDSSAGIPVEPQNITVKAQILPFTARTVEPEVAGNAGYTTMWIKGAKFQEGVTATLAGPGGEVIVPVKCRRMSATQLVAIFDLKGKTAGKYDVVVRNPDNETSTLDEGFTIVNGGGAADPRTTIHGPSSVRGGWVRYTFSFANDGLNDKYLVPLAITLPAAFDYKLDTSNHVGDLQDLVQGDADLSLIPTDYSNNGIRVVTLFAPVLASRKTVNVNIDVRVPFGTSFDLYAMALPALEDWFAFSPDEQVNAVNKAVLQTTPPWICSENRNACFFEIVRGLIFAGLNELLPTGCVGAAWKSLVGVSDLVIGILVKGSEATAWDAIGSLGNLVAGALGELAAGCLTEIPWVKAAGWAILVVKAISDILDCIRAYEDCMKPHLPVTFPRALDPNEKVGPDGYGAEGFIPAGQPIEYRINFENVSDATAPAQTIRIIDDLPPTLDPRTVRLKEIGFKQNRIVVPPNQSFYQNRIQLGEDLNNLKADILAGLDLVNGRIFWTLQAIDPQTGDLPMDPYSGLLPPNNDDRDGEGYVIFTVEARNSYPNRTLISNSATIIFDENEPIITNATENLLDSVIPATQLTIPSGQSVGADVQLAWSGTDDTDGSGLAGYGVYYSENGGAYLPFVTSTFDTEAIFAGRWGKRYRFYSLGKDNAGNAELPPALPDAEITIPGGDTEGDVAPRPNGNDGQVNGSDLEQIRRFVAGLDSEFQYNEFQRVDTAPRDQGGNGGLTAADVVQARRYAAGLDERAEAAGPNQAEPLSTKPVAGKRNAAGAPRELRPVRVNRIGNKLYAAIELEAQGDEVAVGLTLNFPTTDLANPSNYQLGTGAGAGTLTVNGSHVTEGRIGFLLDKGPNDPIPAGRRQLITLEFDLVDGHASSTTLSFGNGPVADEVADGLATPIQTVFSPGTISLVGPTAASVAVSGSVIDGARGIANASVVLTDPNGRTYQARTNNFGSFRINGVPSGGTFVVTVRARQYTFSPRTLWVGGDISDLEIRPD